MMKILGLIFCSLFIFTACEQVDEDQLKQDIKQSIIEELEDDQDDPSFSLNDVTNQLINTTEQIKNCSVGINVIFNESSSGIGSGVLIDIQDNRYYVLTNEHVIRYYDDIEIYLPNDNVYIAANVEKINQELDLALISFLYSQALSICELTEQTYQEGELVLAVGNAVDFDYSQTVTIGIISTITDNLIQHDAALNVGSSGGGLFNVDGELIGINVSRINTTTKTGTIVAVDGIGFAITSALLLEFIAQE